MLGMSIKFIESNICILHKSIPEFKVALNASNNNKIVKGTNLISLRSILVMVGWTELYRTKPINQSKPISPKSSLLLSSFHLHYGLICGADSDAGEVSDVLIV